MSDMMSAKGSFCVKAEINFEEMVLHSKDGSLEKFKLRPIKKENLLRLRFYESKGMPILIYKNGENFFYTNIKKDFKLLNIDFGVSMCTKCSRLSAAEDSKGGCEKVRKRNFTDVKSEYPLEMALCLARFIEFLNFVDEGIETFNSSWDTIEVFKCNQYSASKQKAQKNLTKEQIEKKRAMMETLHEWLNETYRK